MSFKKTNSHKPIKLVILNPPTKEQAEKRIKKLSEYLSKIWNQASSTR